MVSKFNKIHFALATVIFHAQVSPGPYVCRPMVVNAWTDLSITPAGAVRVVNGAQPPVTTEEIKGKKKSNQ